MSLGTSASISTPRACWISLPGSACAQPFQDRHHVLRATRPRPRSQHVVAGIRERPDHGDPRALLQRQHARPVGQEHDRAARGVPRQLPPRLDLTRRRRRGPAAAVRIVQQAKAGLELEHAPDRGIDLRHGHAAALERARQALRVGAAHEVDVDPGVQRERRRLGEVLGHAVRDQLGDRPVVADHDAVEPPAAAHQIVQHRGIRRHRHAGEVVERRHDGGDPGVHGRAERRQIDLLERALREVDRGVVPAGGGRPVAGEVLGGRRQIVRLADVVALETAHLGFGIAGGEPGIFARALGDPAPARVARHVQHRGEGEGQPLGGGFRGGGARRSLPQVRIEGRRLGQRDREDGAVAVDHVESEQQRHAQPGLLDRDPLHLACLVSAPQVADRADPARFDRGHVVARHLRAGDHPAGRDQGHLADLLLESHGVEELLETIVGFRSWHSLVFQL